MIWQVSVLCGSCQMPSVRRSSYWFHKYLLAYSLWRAKLKMMSFSSSIACSRVWSSTHFHHHGQFQRRQLSSSLSTNCGRKIALKIELSVQTRQRMSTAQLPRDVGKLRRQFIVLGWGSLLWRTKDHQIIAIVDFVSILFRCVSLNFKLLKMRFVFFFTRREKRVSVALG